MKRALLLTAYNRPHYLEEVLQSWRSVRGFHDWPLHVFLEPSSETLKIVGMLEDLEHPQLQIHYNPEVYGVLHNPWVGFEYLFEIYDFVVRIEDDLVVSDDILEFFSDQSELWKDDPSVWAVIGYTTELGLENTFRRAPIFDPWVWGTWRDTWVEKIGPTWDHDYSTYNGFPGNQSGWDWNLNTRLYPEHGALSILPTASRVKDIGEYGVHAVGIQTPVGSFKIHRPKGEWTEAEGRDYVRPSP